MTDVITFHSDPEIKAKYLARVDQHIKADQLIRGTGWDESKGCAVGCTLEYYDHARAADETGVPEWLWRLEDRLFERMSEPKSRTWPRDFLAATPVGISADRLEREVKAPLLIFMLEDVKTRFDHASFPTVLAAIDQVIALWNRPDIGSEDWEAAARAAAEAAAEAAAQAAAEAAAWAAYDRYADKLLELLSALAPQEPQP